MNMPLSLLYLCMLLSLFWQILVWLKLAEISCFLHNVCLPTQITGNLVMIILYAIVLAAAAKMISGSFLFLLLHLYVPNLNTNHELLHTHTHAHMHMHAHTHTHTHTHTHLHWHCRWYCTQCTEPHPQATLSYSGATLVSWEEPGNVAMCGWYWFTLTHVHTVDGAELLLDLGLPAAIIGGVVLPLLGAVPDAVMIIFSGISGDREEANKQISVGMG